MTAEAAHVWIRTPDGELVRSDVITGLRCRGGAVEAIRADGTLAGPGCPPDFHLTLLRELETHTRRPDTRWIILITAQISTAVNRWVSVTLDELADTGNPRQLTSGPS